MAVRSGTSSDKILSLADQVTRRGGDVLEFGADLFDQISPVATPSGVLAEIEVRSSVIVDKEHDVLVLAGVQDAGNLGTLLRSAAAAGIRYIWCDKYCAQPWSPKVLRAGMGAHFNLNIVESGDLAAWLADDKRQILVTCLDGDTRSLYELNLSEPSVWIFGSEGQGVPAELRNLADIRVRIPMPGQIESLNVGAAAAVCFFEQVRQRLSR